MKQLDLRMHTQKAPFVHLNQPTKIFELDFPSSSCLNEHVVVKWLQL